MLKNTASKWRRVPESNRGPRICNPLHSHSANAPYILMVPRAGLEPAQRERRGILNPLCLPIPPPGQRKKRWYTTVLTRFAARTMRTLTHLVSGSTEIFNFMNQLANLQPKLFKLPTNCFFNIQYFCNTIRLLKSNCLRSHLLPRLQPHHTYKYSTP